MDTRIKLQLQPYRGTAPITADLDISGDILSVTYHLPADISARRDCHWPSFDRIDRADELWCSTCFEIFIGRQSSQEYIEVNVSPSGAWNSYRFSSYRTGMQQSEYPVLRAVTSEPGAWLKAELQLSRALVADTLISPTVVLEDASGALLYYAVNNADPPDFHRQDLHIPLDASGI